MSNEKQSTRFDRKGLLFPHLLLHNKESVTSVPTFWGLLGFFLAAAAAKSARCCAICAWVVFFGAAFFLAPKGIKNE